MGKCVTWSVRRPLATSSSTERLVAQLSLYDTQWKQCVIG